MAFNLNKGGDEPKKFNLAKSDAASTTPVKNDINDPKPGKEKKSKMWLLLLLLLGAGIGIWYFTSTNATSKTEPESNTTNAGVSNAEGANAANSTPVSPSTSPEATSNTSGNPPANVTNEGDNANPVSENNPDKTNSSAANNNTSNSSEDTKVATNGNVNDKQHIKVVAHFNAGSSNISSREEGEVKEVLDFLKKNSTANITINGYASSEGDPAVNQQLSLKRAEAFKRFLVGKGVSADRIKTTGKGAQEPIESNETSEGRSKNRRVEVVR